MRTKFPILIQPYRGYANRERLFLMGRVLKYKGIRKDRQHRWRIFLDTFRRFESDEIGNILVEITVGDNHFVTTTNHEGYFKINASWKTVPVQHENLWLKAIIQLPEENIKTAVDILYLPETPSFGILSDVDDTVLQTDMNSWLKLRMLYNTFFKNARQRRPMEGMPALLNNFAKGPDGNWQNPVFYVSDSPWNIYDIIADFMEIQQIPKGPLMLRDYGRQMIFNRKMFDSHKIRAITHILETYPELPFIMLGDTASHDADHYLHFAKKYPDRVHAIYIRLTQDSSNARRVARLIEEHSDINVLLVRSSAEMMADARERGIIQ